MEPTSFTWHPGGSRNGTRSFDVLFVDEALPPVHEDTMESANPHERRAPRSGAVESDAAVEPSCAKAHSALA